MASAAMKEVNNVIQGTYVASGNLTEGTIKNYASAIDGLNVRQAQMALTTKGLTNEQQKQILIEAGLIGSKERISASLVKQALETTALSDAEQKRLLITLGLIDADTGEIIVENTCTDAKLRSALASTNLSTTEKEALIAKLTGTTANTGYAVSFDVLTASIWANIKALGAWLISNPIGWIVGAAGAVTLIVGLVDLFTTTVDENNKVIEESTQKIGEQQQAIDDLNDKQKSATDAYKEYASLISKSNAYGLTASEKEHLLSLSKDLVDTYGLEVDGIDSVTGAYRIGADAINKYVDALRAERNMKLSEQSEERKNRVDASIDNAKKYQKTYNEDMDLINSDEYKTAIDVYKKNYDNFRDIQDKYNLLKKDINSGKINKASFPVTSLEQQFRYQVAELGIDNNISSIIWDKITGDIDNIENDSAMVSQKLSNTVKSIIKDVFADIAVNSGDMLDDGGESLLTKLLEPYLTNVDWDNFDKDDFEEKVQNFITQASDRLSSVSSKLDTSQKDIANGNINLDGYKKFYSTLQEEVSLLDEMRQQDVISEESYNNQLSQIQQEITSNLGLAMTDISNTFAETDAQSKTRFESIANEFINLENQFKTGSITSIEYLDALTSKIENMDFTSVFQNNKEGAQEFFSSLTANVSTILEDTMTQFETGSLTVTEYGDRLADFAQQQKALAKNAVEEAEALGITGDELDNIKTKYEETSSSIDDAIAKWEELRGINLFLDENASFLQEGITINTDGYQNFANDLYNQFSSLSSDLQNEVLQNMQTVQGYANVTSENLLATMQDSVGATRGLAEAIAQGTAGTLSSVVNNGGEVLSALGDAIQAFTYTISFEPKSIGTMDTPVKIGDNEIFSLKLPFLSYDIKGSSTGNFGEKLKNLGDSLSAYSISMTSSNYGGGKTANNGSSNNSASSSGSSDKDKSGGGSSKEKDPEKEREDQEKKELEQLKASLDARKEVIEKYKESIDITDFGLDISEEKDFALRTDLLNSKLNQVTAYGQAMRKEFERVSKIVPKTADQAEALSSQLSTLGSNMRNNVKTLRETQIALQQLKINAVTTSAKDNMDDMQTELSRLEKRIGLLNDDNKNEYKYTNKILNMETLLPTNAEMTGRRKNRSRADQDVIRAEEETQNVLNDMYQEQIKKNENLREDERQALLDAMAVMRND